MNRSELKTFLEECFQTYHRPEYVHLDPLICLQGYSRAPDLEIAGLIAAMLAYGRVETIIANVTDVFRRMDTAPSHFAQKAPFQDKAMRKINPFDPVKYDFSLCRSGMISHPRRAA
jgi:hypothetical protein